MEFTKKDVEHLANLSMLNLSEEEIEKYTKDIQEIIVMAEQVNEVDTDGVDASAFALDSYNVFRKDEVRQSLDREALLQNAPSSNGEAYQLPSMVE